VGYVYPHDEPEHFARQDYLPPGWKREPFYTPGEQGFESEIARRLQKWWGENLARNVSREAWNTVNLDAYPKPDLDVPNTQD
jgi:hypothetical protein